MLSKETIELLEKYNINYENKDEEEIAEIVSAIREMEDMRL